MIGELRKRHKRIWWFLAVIVPFGFIATIVNSPRPLDNLGGKGQAFSVAVQASSITVKISQPLRSAFTEVYAKSGTNCGEVNFLGAVSSVGTYTFQTLTDKRFCEVYLYDQLNKIEIESVILN